MGKNKLQEGDVFKLESGMKAYIKIPEKYCYSNRPNSNKKTKRCVTLGESMKNRYQVHYEGEVIGDAVEELDTSQFIGEYVVVSAKMGGGGTGHGPHDYYPDGWEIKARRLNKDGSFDPSGELISFYQSGSFTAINEDVNVIRSLEKKTTFE